jgi:hypothetical protein
VRVICVQYADDTLPLLRQLTPACVQAFLAFMHVFQMASRLALNPPKSQLLALGDAVPPDGVLPESVCGLAVVTEAASLGAVVEAGGEPQPEWDELVDQLALKYDKLARLPLSAFGRASAAAAYGVGRLLHRAAMHAVPQRVIDRLHRISKRLVDAGVGPTPVASRARRVLPGVPSALLRGRPARGGMGMMPWAEHLHACRAVCLRRIIVSVSVTPLCCTSGGSRRRRPPKVVVVLLLPLPPPQAALLLPLLMMMMPRACLCPGPTQPRSPAPGCRRWLPQWMCCSAAHALADTLGWCCCCLRRRWERLMQGGCRLRSCPA